MKIVDYIICERESKTQLEIIVKDHIKQGYVPIGGVESMKSGFGFSYMQSMIKYYDNNADSVYR